MTQNYLKAMKAGEQLSKARTDPYSALVAGILVQAARDAVKGDQESRQWLQSKEAAMYLEHLGINPDAATRWIQNGCNKSKKKENKMTSPVDISEQIRRAIEDNDLTDEQLTGFTNALNENLPQAIDHAVAQAKAGRGDQATMMKNYKAEIAKAAGSPTAVAKVKAKYLNMGLRGIW